jgi:hypothetical protein
MTADQPAPAGDDRPPSRRAVLTLLVTGGVAATALVGHPQGSA